VTRTITRRGFLKGAAAGGAGLILLPSARSARGYPANERLNLAIVGVGGYAAATAFTPGMHLYENAGIVALCDVDERKLPPVFEMWEKRAREWPSSTRDAERKGAEVYARLVQSPPKFYPDFRRMLDESGKDIDAVVVATPDHSHAVISAACLRAKKHVLCEKPLTITVREARTLRARAAEAGTATSMNNQGTQSPQHRRGVELIRDGVLGDIGEVHLWFARGGQNHRARPEGEAEVPKELHWDLWLGPVAARPYHPRWIARNHWRETSAGELGNFGPHTGNLPFRALGIEELWKADGAASQAAPIRVKATFSELNRLSFPRWEVIEWKVPARGPRPPVTVYWHHGPKPGLAPGFLEKLAGVLRDQGVPEAKAKDLLEGTGAVLIGSKGALLTNSHNTDITLLPESRFKDVDVRQPRSLPLSRGHYQDWMRACRGGEAPWARFDYAATFNEFLMLGAVATQFESELAYDPVAGRILNHADADRALGYDYRTGWSLM